MRLAALAVLAACNGNSRHALGLARRPRRARTSSTPRRRCGSSLTEPAPGHDRERGRRGFVIAIDVPATGVDRLADRRRARRAAARVVATGTSPPFPVDAIDATHRRSTWPRRTRSAAAPVPLVAARAPSSASARCATARSSPAAPTPTGAPTDDVDDLQRVRSLDARRDAAAASAGRSRARRRREQHRCTCSAATDATGTPSASCGGSTPPSHRPAPTPTSRTREPVRPAARSRSRSTPVTS